MIFPFSNAGIVTVTYTQAMRELYGDLPTLIVYHYAPTVNDVTPAYQVANVEVSVDANPATQIRVDNGGAATGYLKVSK